MTSFNNDEKYMVLYNKPIREASYHDETDILKSEIWRVGGLFHKNNGPAIIRYYTDGSIYNVNWCLNGIKFDLELWCRRTDNDPLLMKMMYTA